ncbi:hypothetical protein HRH04_08170 [Enterococcus faecalis]|nr:hypothetical protein [Enterococcus faecalis]EGO8565543.1 hypothetical protein [Enterococcus faecalis]EGO8712110.1 hypothetical protein [Enterococcus faecalis]EIQ7138330.1 hypothetical protein [Enterococcus faecalis]EIQ7162005.1 hypothetical protein [Enterococcus faecalis]EIT1920338.1 hypothetical protein [Enterococcus faecalis]
MNPKEKAQEIVSTLEKENLSNQTKKRKAVAKMNEWALATKTEVTNEEIEKEIEGAYNGLK